MMLPMRWAHQKLRVALADWTFCVVAFLVSAGRAARGDRSGDREHGLHRDRWSSDPPEFMRRVPESAS